MENPHPITFHAPTLPGQTPASLDALALAVCALITLLLLFLLLRSLRRTTPKAPQPEKSQTPQCRWTKARGGHRTELTKWTCRTCGADGFSTTSTPPRTCKTALRPAAL
ncbi:hypothetical protein [Gymnodinialimonas ulvae]|uniref:hypothetical protein n=1 Tax=Gymnodinialimonas ulvae TaxID=3126504 RepID=UPI0030B7C700